MSVLCLYIIIYTIHGNIWQGEILVNHTGKIYLRGKFWRISYSRYIHMPNIFSMYMWEYWQGKFWRIAHDSLNSSIFCCAKIFLRMVCCDGWCACREIFNSSPHTTQWPAHTHYHIMWCHWWFDGNFCMKLIHHGSTHCLRVYHCVCNLHGKYTTQSEEMTEWINN